MDTTINRKDILKEIDFHISVQDRMILKYTRVIINADAKIYKKGYAHELLRDVKAEKKAYQTIRNYIILSTTTNHKKKWGSYV